MNKSLSARIMDLLQRRQLKGTLAKIALTISCVAIFLITYLLVAPVLTQEWETVCGMEEHVHTEECYTLVPADSAEAAEPTGAVKPAEPAEPAQGGHHHTDECYEEVPAEPGEGGHHHTDECYEEVIVEPAVEGHSHTSDCYEESSSLSCGMSEHSHSDGCLDEEGNQVCGMDEHSHSDSCYETSSELVCGQEETEGREAKTERQLICGQEETDGQEPATERRLVCGMEETDGAEETADETAEEPAGEDEAEETGEADAEGQEPEMIRVLTCGKEEHVHSDQCYQKHEISGPEYICGFLTEHAHDDSCYFESGELKCTIPEHTHDDSCLTPQVTVSQVSGIFPEGLPEGYIEIPSMDESAAFAIDEAGQPVPQGVKAQVYAPENAFEEGQEIVFVSQPLDEQTEEYDEFASALAEEQGDEENYNNLTAMDLGFYNENGDEVEPNTENGPVYVRLTIPMELAEEPDFDLWHYNDAESQEDPENVLEQMDVDFNYENGVLTVDFAADSFSPFMLRMKAKAENSGFVQWGTTDPVVPYTIDTDGTWIWDVSSTSYRNLKIPVQINVSGQGATVTLPSTLSGVGRTSKDNPTLERTGIDETNWTVTENETDGTVTITSKNPSSSHDSLHVYYQFDCWNVKSDWSFDVSCQIAPQTGSKEQRITLKGKIHTGHGVETKEYLNAWGDSEYSFYGFGGVDRGRAYLMEWNSVYETYFGLRKENFDSENYIYDIAPFLVSPQGQQPYDISGTVRPDQGGEVIGAAYMMDTLMKPDTLCLEQVPVSDGQFNISNDQLKIDERSAVVSGNLTDPTDSKTYTLYFLVRYPKNGLSGSVSLNATLSLTHTGVDDHQVSTTSATAQIYQGPKEPFKRIYWGSYARDSVQSPTGLGTLKKGQPATVDFSADVFALNEARTDRQGKYRLETIIDLTFLTNEDGTPRGGNPMLTEDDYRFSAYKISLVDAEGAWTYGNDNVPIVGWTDDKFKVPDWAASEMIEIYGSTSLGENDWEEIGKISAADVWAMNKDRDFVIGYQPIAQEGILRLKVAYNSRLTTALRVGYQLELQPSILDKHGISDLDQLNLTTWFNYVGYKGTEADETNSDVVERIDGEGMFFQRYPVDDSNKNQNWDPENGTIELARQHDNKSPFHGYNELTGAWEGGYSFRNFAKATLGSSTDAAGMIVTQALYDSTGKIVGANEQPDSRTDGKSFCQQADVVNASEVVYSISGVVTNGAYSFPDLQEQIENAGTNSPYKSLKMRYYVLLPTGLKLNWDPDHGEIDENGNPKHHYWNENTDRFLSANSTFYNHWGNKYVNGWDTAVPMSKGNVQGWQRISANGSLTEMHWNSDGSVQLNRESSKGQLLVFERTIEEATVENQARFNMWGTSEVQFWGRGLSFSVVPTDGVGSLAPGNYQVQFWCQFLDGKDNPIPLTDFQKEEVTETPVKGMDEETLLYIPIEFNNRSHQGDTDGKIGLEIKAESQVMDKDGNVKPGFIKPNGTYQYPLTYQLNQGFSKDVVLWCDIEQHEHQGADGRPVKSDWNGLLTGVNLNDTGASVYVRKQGLKKETETDIDYTQNASKALLTEENGWIEINNPETYSDWSSVKAIAFSFEETFSSDNNIATVYLNMKAPKDDGLYLVTGEGDSPIKVPKTPEKTEYKAYNEMIVSDVHFSKKTDGTPESQSEGCWVTNFTTLIIDCTPVSYVLPSTGGAGSATMCATGMALILAAMGLMYLTLRRSRKQREGGNV